VTVDVVLRCRLRHNCYCTPLIFYIEVNIVIWYDDRWIMNWKGFGRKRSWPNGVTIPAFLWRDWKKIRLSRNTAKYFSLKWQLTIERLLLTDPPVDRICSTCSQRVQRLIGALCYCSLTQHHYDYLVERDLLSIWWLCQYLRQYSVKW
jgi:hypothetical protein